MPEKTFDLATFLASTKPPSELALKLAARIKELCGITVKPYIHRTRSGRLQKEAGAWSWFMIADTCWVASQQTATRVANAKYLSHSKLPSERSLGYVDEVEIFIEEKPPVKDVELVPLEECRNCAGEGIVLTDGDDSEWVKCPACWGERKFTGEANYHRVHDHIDLLKMLCSGQKKYGIYLNYTPKFPPLDKQEEDRVRASLRNGLQKDNELVIVLATQRWAFLFFETDELMTKAYHSIDGDDTGGNIYAINCDAKGQTRNENS